MKPLSNLSVYENGAGVKPNGCHRIITRAEAERLQAEHFAALDRAREAGVTAMIREANRRCRENGLIRWGHSYCLVVQIGGDREQRIAAAGRLIPRCPVCDDHQWPDAAEVVAALSVEVV